MAEDALARRYYPGHVGHNNQSRSIQLDCDWEKAAVDHKLHIQFCLILGGVAVWYNDRQLLSI